MISKAEFSEVITSVFRNDSNMLMKNEKTCTLHL